MSTLLAAWRDASLATVWRHPSDWMHPAVEALVEAVENGDDPIAPAHRLGTARSELGSDMSETLDDVMCLFTTIGIEAPSDVVRAVAVGWAEAQPAPATSRSCTDPLTGLRTAAYLAARLEELYDQAPGADAPHQAERWCLLLIDVGTEGGQRLDELRVGARVGAALADVFGVYHASAQLRPGLFAVMTPRGADMPDVLAAVRAAFARLTAADGAPGMRSPARLWLEGLPTEATRCAWLLDSLRS